jgi:hypothetical protein
MAAIVCSLATQEQQATAANRSNTNDYPPKPTERSPHLALTLAITIAITIASNYPAS